MRAAAVVGLLATCATAHADPEDEYAPVIIGLDAGAIASGVVAMKTNDRLLAVALGLYTLGGPVTHVAYGDYGRAGISLGARLVAPAIGFYAGAVVDPGLVTWGQVIGPLVGAGAAMVLDWVVLSKGPPFTDASASASASAKLVSMTLTF